MVDSGGLENRYTFTGIQSSNLCLSATFLAGTIDLNLVRQPQPCEAGTYP